MPLLSSGSNRPRGSQARDLYPRDWAPAPLPAVVGRTIAFILRAGRCEPPPRRSDGLAQSDHRAGPRCPSHYKSRLCNARIADPRSQLSRFRRLRRLGEHRRQPPGRSLPADAAARTSSDPACETAARSRIWANFASGTVRNTETALPHWTVSARCVGSRLPRSGSRRSRRPHRRPATRQRVGELTEGRHCFRRTRLP